MSSSLLPTLVPIAVLAVVFVRRWRNISRPRPLKPERLWVVPAVVVVLVAAMMAGMPPSRIGWLAIAAGLAIGGAVGWKRGHWTHLDRDPASGAVMARQSPAALLMLLGIFVAKRALAAAVGADPGAGAHAALAPQALVVTDGLFGFAIGMVVMTRWTLWRRAAALPPHPVSAE